MAEFRLTDSDADGIKELRRQLVELRAENDRLRGLLGVGTRDEAVSPWEPTLFVEDEVTPTAPQSPPWIATRRERQRSQYSDRCLWGEKTFMLGAGRTPAAPRPAGALLSAVVGPIQRNPAGSICPFQTRSSGPTLRAKSTLAYTP